MPVWLAASAAYFAYVALMAALMRDLTWGRRARALGGVLAGAAAVAAAAYTDDPILRVWVLPPALLLLAYWSTGALFVAPMPNVERALQSVDERLRIRERASRFPGWFAAFLELAYVGVYLLIPIALALHFWFADPPDPDRFWAVVLVTDYLCFATLPWLQSRPPRSVEPGEPWHSSLRRLNLGFMETASIRVNTFPSGHAAEALAVALLVLQAPWPWVAWMFFNVVAISAGAVFGRYHYAVDVFAGWGVALLVWLLI